MLFLTDGGGRSHSLTRLQSLIPCNRERNREFYGFALISPDQRAKNAMISELLNHIPW